MGKRWDPKETVIDNTLAYNVILTNVEGSEDLEPNLSNNVDVKIISQN